MSAMLVEHSFNPNYVGSVIQTSTFVIRVKATRTFGFQSQLRGKGDSDNAECSGLLVVDEVSIPTTWEGRFRR